MTEEKETVSKVWSLARPENKAVKESFRESFLSALSRSYVRGHNQDNKDSDKPGSKSSTSTMSYVQKEAILDLLPKYEHWLAMPNKTKEEKSLKRAFGGRSHKEIPYFYKLGKRYKMGEAAEDGSRQLLYRDDDRLVVCNEEMFDIIFEAYPNNEFSVLKTWEKLRVVYRSCPQSMIDTFVRVCPEKFRVIKQTTTGKQTQGKNKSGLLLDARYRAYYRFRLIDTKDEWLEDATDGVTEFIFLMEDESTGYVMMTPLEKKDRGSVARELHRCCSVLGFPHGFSGLSFGRDMAFDLLRYVIGTMERKSDPWLGNNKDDHIVSVVKEMLGKLKGLDKDRDWAMDVSNVATALNIGLTSVNMLTVAQDGFDWGGPDSDVAYTKVFGRIPIKAKVETETVGEMDKNRESSGDPLVTYFQTTRGSNGRSSPPGDKSGDSSDDDFDTTFTETKLVTNKDSLPDVVTKTNSRREYLPYHKILMSPSASVKRWNGKDYRTTPIVLQCQKCCAGKSTNDFNGYQAAFYRDHIGCNGWWDFDTIWAFGKLLLHANHKQGVILLGEMEGGGVEESEEAGFRGKLSVRVDSSSTVVVVMSHNNHFAVLTVDFPTKEIKVFDDLVPSGNPGGVGAGSDGSHVILKRWSGPVQVVCSKLGLPSDLIGWEKSVNKTQNWQEDSFSCELDHGKETSPSSRSSDSDDIGKELLSSGLRSPKKTGSTINLPPPPKPKTEWQVSNGRLQAILKEAEVPGGERRKSNIAGRVKRRHGLPIQHHGKPVPPPKKTRGNKGCACKTGQCNTARCGCFKAGNKCSGECSCGDSCCNWENKL